MLATQSGIAVQNANIFRGADDHCGRLADIFYRYSKRGQALHNNIASVMAGNIVHCGGGKCQSISRGGMRNQ